MRTPQILPLMVALLALPAAAAQLVKNINTVPQTLGGLLTDSDPRDYVEVGNRLYFSAKTIATGREYFYVDGSGSPAQLLADLVPGPGESAPKDLVALPNGKVVFTALNASGTRELWGSDGTTSGTQRLSSTGSLGGAGNPQDLVVHQGACYFLAAPVGTFSLFLWRTDGTPAGTVKLDSLNLVGPYGPEAQMLVSTGSQLFYTASVNSSGGAGIWRLYTSDGTAGGSTLVQQFQETSWFGPRELTALGSRVVFQAQGLSTGQELAVSDGTAAGTAIIDLIPGALGSGPRELRVVNNHVMFVANEASTGGEIFASNGTVAGTYRVSNSFPGTSNPNGLQSIGHQLAFAVNDGVHGNELWTANPTPNSEALFADINPGPESSDPSLMRALNGGIVCRASRPLTGAELYFSTGSPAGTGVLLDVWPGGTSSNVSDLARYGNQVVFSATSPNNGREPWITNGTGAGTKLLADVAASNMDQSSLATYFTRIGQRAVFKATDGLTGNELWATDGTLLGTERLTEFKGAMGSLGDLPLAPLLYRDKVYLPLDDGQHGFELWATDGTAAGTQLAVELNPGFGGSNPRPLREWRDELYFSASLSGAFAYNLFVTNGQQAGTRQVTFFGPIAGIDTTGVPVEHQGRLYFMANSAATGSELWSTDGTSAGLVQVTDLAPGPQSGLTNFAAASLGSRLYFAGRAANNQVELFRTDGTLAGTSLFADLNGPLSSNPGAFERIGNQLVFNANINGQYQYFSTDGTTVQQLTFPPFYVGWNDLGKTKSKVIGMLRGSGGSFHLWGSDGTVTGSGVIAQISPNDNDYVNFRAWPVSSGEKLLFAAGNSAVGSEIFVTDGVTASPLFDLAPGTANSDPAEVVHVGDKLIFGASDELTGFELYSLPFGLVGDYVAQPYGQGCLGSNGQEPKIAVSGAAAPGGNLTIDVSGTAPFAALAHYWSPGFGLLKVGNCSVYLATPLFLSGQGASVSGSASLPIAIPNNPSLIGMGLWWQTLAIDPGAELLGLAALTAALEVRF